MKATKKELLKFIKDEKRTAKIYKSRGFNTLSKDEKSHAKIFKKAIKRL